MASVDIYSQEKKKLSTMQLSQAWVGPVVKGAVYEVALWHQACRRAGTASTKARSEVRGSGRKIYRQKGTGNARHADRQAPIFVGGGISGGPKPRDWSYSIPKKERQQALKSVLIHKVNNERLCVIEKVDFGAIKTKLAQAFFAKWPYKSALLVMETSVDNVVKSVRNLPNYKTCAVSSLNVADLLSYDGLIISKAALEMVEERWLKSV